MRRLMAVVVVALALGACGGDDDGDGSGAGDAVRELATQHLRGQYGRAYESLHPLHQEMLSKRQYEDCMLADPTMQTELDKLEVVETYNETVGVPGTDVEAEATAVTLRMTLDGDTMNQTLRVIDVEGEWRWMLTTDLLEDCDN